MMENVSFLAEAKKSSIKVEKPVLIEEISIGQDESGEEPIKLYYQALGCVFSVYALVPNRLVSVKTKILLRPGPLYIFCTSYARVKMNGIYTDEKEIYRDALALDHVYHRFLPSNETCVIEEDSDIEFLSATLDSQCIERTSVVFEIGGRDATMCTLSHGHCNNALLKYSYTRRDKLVVQVIGPGNIVLIGTCEAAPRSLHT